MKQLPIRVRLTLPFALAMALVLTALGAVLYVRVGSTLLANTDQGLRGQATEALTHLDDERPLLDRDSLDSAGIAEVIAPNGAVSETSPAGLPRLLGGSAVTAAARRGVFVTAAIPGLKGTWRLRAVPAGNGRVLVVGKSLASRDETLDRLLHEFLFSAPLALLLATLAGYLLAGAALHPVEAMRRRAAAITAATPGARLPVPAARDEISRLATTINDMLARLEDALRHERRFVADASHELRTPLALLRTELELALRRTRSHEELEEALRSAAEETDRLTSLAEDLLLVARIDQGALPVRRERVHARELFDTVAGRFAARAGESGRNVRVSGENVVIEADPARLEQALGNLVANGLVHGAGTVELSARPANGHVELHVTDEGPGFPTGFAKRAFDRFSRGDEARGRGGTGLGLAIVQAIAEAHGGSAGIGNRKGGGADVWIALDQSS
jgi:two-component system OmpR family sensor kinase